MYDEKKQQSISGRQEKIIWGLVGALVILVLLGIFWLGLWYGAKKCVSTSAENNVTQPAAPAGKVTVGQTVPGQVAAPAETVSSVSSSQPTAAPEKPAGWQTYANNNQGYKISYPGNGKISQPDPNDFEPGSAPAEGSCVTFKLANGYVTVYGKNNDPNMAGACLGTGVGTEWGPVGKINVEIFGKKYSVSGMGTSSASAGYRQEFYVVDTDSGERIRFGIEVNEKYAPEVTYENAKAEVLAVLKTIEHI